MTKLISFAWTTPALISGNKTVTRRQWNADYARRFKVGDEITAYDRLPRNGGKPIATLRLTHDASYEPDADAPDSDYAAEGFKWFNDREWDRATKQYQDGELEEPVPDSEIADRTDWYGFERWRQAEGFSWVVRFEVVSLVSSSKGDQA